MKSAASHLVFASAVWITLCGAVRAQATDTSSQANTAVTAPTKFDAASIKASSATEKRQSINSFHWEGGRFTATNISAARLIGYAYGLRQQQLEGLPNWAESEGFTIEAVMPPDMPQLSEQEMPQVRRRVLQSLLMDRFALKLHKTTDLLPVFEIVVAKGGAKLTPHDANDQEGAGVTGTPNGFKFVGVPVQFLAYYLSMYAGRIVIDKTGFTGRYDVTLSGVALIPNPVAADTGAESGAPGHGDVSGESIFDAMKEQLGLELKSAKEPITVFVVDHVESPTAN